MKMDEVILNVSNLKTYFFTHRGVVKAVNGIDFELHRGECLCLVGESGCGKTVTALSILRLFDSPPGKIVDGRVSFRNRELTECSSAQMRRIRGKDIAVVFQEAQSALNPVLTIGDQITEQMKLHLPLDHNQIKERAIAMLGEMGIPSPEKAMSYYPHQLSGGMKQRVLIAMSLSCDPQILIADEPTTAVDVTIKAQILDIFRGLKTGRQMSTIFITHDLAVVSEIGDRAVVMYGGKDVETASVREIINSPKHPYTSGLIDCLPDAAKSGDRLTSIPGTTPNPVQMPEGCTFHPRCPKAMKVCEKKEPLKTRISEGRSVSCHLYS
jgi:peptide/nickel transport system ATP-binding protein